MALKTTPPSPCRVERRRLLVLATYPRMAAATRFRACSYFPALVRRGIDPDLQPFMDEKFMRELYLPGNRLQKAADIARFSLQRLRMLLGARSYDAVFVQREAMLVGPALVERLLAQVTGLPLLFDIDDAVWLDNGESSRFPIAARLLKFPRKSHSLMKLATEVITATQYLADYASQYSQRVTVVPTVVSRETWQPMPGRLDGAFGPGDGIPTVGWVGTHSTAEHLDIVVPALRALASEGLKFRVRLVGASRSFELDGVVVESVPWREESEVDDFRRIDVGIAPIGDGLWSRGKGGFKAIQYMAVGVPMVASPVGGAAEFLEHGSNALLATSTEEWKESLRSLLEDRALRSRLSRAGRALVESRFCTEVQADVVGSLVERAMASRPRRSPRTILD